MDFSLDIASAATIAGTIAGGLSIGAFLPQAWRIWSRRSASDVSLAMYLTIVAGNVLWMFYAYVHRSVELFATNAVIAVIAAAIAAMRIRFGDRGE